MTGILMTYVYLDFEHTDSPLTVSLRTGNRRDITSILRLLSIGETQR